MRQFEKLNEDQAPPGVELPWISLLQAQPCWVLLLLDKEALSSLTSQLPPLHHIQLLDSLPRLQNPGDVTSSVHSP